MSYAQRVRDHWSETIGIAFEGGANAIQLEALEDLSDEFGYRSDNRLKALWKTAVDKDGDVILAFGNMVVGDGALAVNVYIDHEGMVTTHDILTDVKHVINPHDEAFVDKAGVKHLIWIIDTQLLEPFFVESIRLEVMPRVDGRYLAFVEEMADSGIYYDNVALLPDVKMVQSTAYYDGPIAGYCRVNGKLAVFNQDYEDDVSGERIYGLRFLTGFEAFKMHANHQILRAQTAFNKWMWPGQGKKWVKFRCFKIDKSSHPGHGYCMFRDPPINPSADIQVD
jgi:hypothetical protein